LAKWPVELGEHGLEYFPRTAIKGQILADFLVENPKVDQKDILSVIEKEKEPEYEESMDDTWTIYTDRASNTEGAGAGLPQIDPS
jgi:hypothetical protein